MNERLGIATAIRFMGRDNQNIVERLSVASKNYEDAKQKRSGFLEDVKKSIAELNGIYVANNMDVPFLMNYNALMAFVEKKRDEIRELEDERAKIRENYLAVGEVDRFYDYSSYAEVSVGYDGSRDGKNSVIRRMHELDAQINDAWDVYRSLRSELDSIKDRDAYNAQFDKFDFLASLVESKSHAILNNKNVDERLANLINMQFYGIRLSLESARVQHEIVNQSIAEFNSVSDELGIELIYDQDKTTSLRQSAPVEVEEKIEVAPEKVIPEAVEEIVSKPIEMNKDFVEPKVEKPEPIQEEKVEYSSSDVLSQKEIDEIVERETQKMMMEREQNREEKSPLQLGDSLRKELNDALEDIEEATQKVREEQSKEAEQNLDVESTVEAPAVEEEEETQEMSATDSAPEQEEKEIRDPFGDDYEEVPVAPEAPVMPDIPGVEVGVEELTEEPVEEQPQENTVVEERKTAKIKKSKIPLSGRLRVLEAKCAKMNPYVKCAVTCGALSAFPLLAGPLTTAMLAATIGSAASLAINKVYNMCRFSLASVEKAREMIATGKKDVFFLEELAGECLNMYKKRKEMRNAPVQAPESLGGEMLDPGQPIDDWTDPFEHDDTPQMRG